MRARKPAQDRFNEKWEPVTESGCWIWTGTVCGENDYGQFFIDKHVRAHRASWMLHKGEIPDGMLVLHKCDIPQCVNPDHLFLGTQQDNIIDMTAKGRHHYQKRTHCKNGHEFTDENTRLAKNRGNARVCIKCNAEYQQKHRDKALTTKED